MWDFIPECWPKIIAKKEKTHFMLYVQFKFIYLKWACSCATDYFECVQRRSCCISWWIKVNIMSVCSRCVFMGQRSGGGERKWHCSLGCTSFTLHFAWNNVIKMHTHVLDVLHMWNRILTVGNCRKKNLYHQISWNDLNSLLECHLESTWKFWSVLGRGAFLLTLKSFLAPDCRVFLNHHFIITL